jgi:hypothetical protein
VTALSSNTFTVAAGTYHVSGWATACCATACSAAINLCLASSGGVFIFGGTTTGETGECIYPQIDGFFTRSSSTVVDLRQVMNVTGSLIDHGRPMNTAGRQEFYAFLTVTRIL